MSRIYPNTSYRLLTGCEQHRLKTVGLDNFVMHLAKKKKKKNLSLWNPFSWDAWSRCINRLMNITHMFGSPLVGHEVIIRTGATHSYPAVPQPHLSLLDRASRVYCGPCIREIWWILVRDVIQAVHILCSVVNRLRVYELW